MKLSNISFSKLLLKTEAIRISSLVSCHQRQYFQILYITSWSGMIIISVVIETRSLSLSLVVHFPHCPLPSPLYSLCPMHSPSPIAYSFSLFPPFPHLRVLYFSVSLSDMNNLPLQLGLIRMGVSSRRWSGWVMLLLSHLQDDIFLWQYTWHRGKSKQRYTSSYTPAIIIYECMSLIYWSGVSRDAHFLTPTLHYM